MSRSFFRFWFMLVPYAACLYLSLWLAVVIRYGDAANVNLEAHFKVFSIIFIFWLVVYFIHGLFEISSLRRYSGLLVKLTSATVVNLLVAVTYFYIQPNLILTPRRFLLIDLAVSFLLMLFWLLLLKSFLKNRLTEGLFLFSLNNEMQDLETEIKAHSYLGFRVLGHLNTETIVSTNLDKNTAVILPENINSLPQIVQRLYDLRDKGVQFYNYLNFYENLFRRINLDGINQLWFLENINYQEKRFYSLIKRIIDLILGLVGLVFFIVSFPFCALIIKLSDSKGPILFTQERVGKHGKVFKVYKYRSMKAGTVTNTWTSVNDPRIFPFGKFLRKSRIDEWPQFINLIIGNMSVVGPRPEQPQIVKDLSHQISFYEERHLVKPGLTGWAQINNVYAGNAEETKLKLQYDLYYIKHRGFLFDLEIILKTIYYVLTLQGR